MNMRNDPPADRGHDSKARRKNRRAEFVPRNPPGSPNPSVRSQTINSPRHEVRAPANAL